MKDDQKDQNSINQSQEHRGFPSSESQATSELKAAPSFTPGPWRISDESQNIIFHPIRRGVAIATVDPDTAHPMSGYMGHRVMMTDEEWENSQKDGWREAQEAEKVANARLIAAAPALYEAGLAALAKLESLWYGPCDEITELRAALALANTQNTDTLASSGKSSPSR